MGKPVEVQVLSWAQKESLSRGFEKRWLNRVAVCRFGRFEFDQRAEDFWVENSRIVPFI